MAIVPKGSGAKTTESAITPVERVCCSLNILSFFSPKTLVRICLRFTSPKIPLVFLSVKILCRLTISVDKVSIFF